MARAQLALCHKTAFTISHLRPVRPRTFPASSVPTPTCQLGTMGTKAKPLAVGTTLAALLFKRPPALIPAVPAVPIMMVVVVGVICVEMSVVWVITVVMMVVRMMIIAVPPSCGWSRAADCDCADNA